MAAGDGKAMQPRQNQGNRPNVSAALNRERRVLFRSYVICSIAHASWRGLGWRAALALCAVAFFACGMASAQDKGILNPQPLHSRNAVRRVAAGFGSI